MKLMMTQSRSGLLSQMALADLDGDGLLDLVSGSDAQAFPPSAETANVSAFRGRGDGTFQTKDTFLIPSGSRAVYGAYSAAADLNRDGVPDLVTTSTAKDSVSVRLGLGDGSFAPGTDYDMGGGPSGILLADFDDDGNLDIACAAHDDGMVGLRFGSGDGRFSERSLWPVSGSPRLLARVDWDQDGTMDLLVGDDYLHILPGLGNGRFAKAIDCAISLSHNSKGGAAPPPVFADVDGDGRWDLAVGNGILFGMHGCNLASRADYDDWWPLLSDDFNGDGSPDLVAVAYPWLLLMTGNGTTHLGGPTKLADFFGQPDYGTAVAGDLDGDGRLDLVVAGIGGVAVLLNTCQ